MLTLARNQGLGKNDQVLNQNLKNLQFIDSMTIITIDKLSPKPLKRIEGSNIKQLAIDRVASNYIN